MDDEKPFDLRDRIAVELLGAIVSNSAGGTDIQRDLTHYITYTHDYDDDAAKEQQQYAAARFEKLIRGCYKVADIMRRVRLTPFE